MTITLAIQFQNTVLLYDELYVLSVNDQFDAESL